MGKGLLARGAAQSPAAAAPAPVIPQQQPSMTLGMPAPSASSLVPLPGGAPPSASSLVPLPGVGVDDIDRIALTTEELRRRYGDL